MEWEIGNPPSNFFVNGDCLTDVECGFWEFFPHQDQLEVWSCAELATQFKRQEEEDDRLEDHPGVKPPNGKKRKRKQYRKRKQEVLRAVGLDELKEHFHKPIEEVARQIGVSLTLFKKHLRVLGIPRWPGRKVCSISTVIHRFKPSAGEHQLLCEIEEERRVLLDCPDTHLSDTVKKLRQKNSKDEFIIRKKTPHVPPITI